MIESETQLERERDTFQTGRGKETGWIGETKSIGKLRREREREKKERERERGRERGRSKISNLNYYISVWFLKLESKSF